MGMIDKIKSMFEEEKIEYRVSPYNGSILCSKNLSSWQKYTWEHSVPFELPEGVTVAEAEKKLGYIYSEYAKLYSIFINDIFIKDPTKTLLLTKLPDSPKTPANEETMTFQTSSNTSISFLNINYEE